MSNVLFGEWLPDQTDFKNPGLEVCKNAVPSPRGYQPALDAVRQEGVNISGRVVGAASFERANGTPVIVCASQSDLFVIVSGTSTASSLSLTLAIDDFVVFEQFNTKVYASTKNGDTWVLDNIETDTAFVLASGSPPNANAMARVGDFLVMGNLQDIDLTSAPYRIRWSQFNNPGGVWETDIATQSGAVDLDALQGPVTAISGGSFGMVFQKNGISRLTYTGSGSVFDKELYEKNRGCVAPRSVVRVGDVAYFLSGDGFFSTDGSSVQSISRGKVWEWFLANSNQTFIQNVIGAAHWESRCVIWLFPGGDDDSMTGQLWWNWETGQWGYVEQALGYALETGIPGLTLEQVAATYSNLDTMPVSLDSQEFKASGRALAGFLEEGVGSPFFEAFSAAYEGRGELVTGYATITGSPLAAEFVSGSFQLKSGKRNFVRGVTPLIENDAQDMSVTLYCREKMVTPLEASDTKTVGPIGFSPFNHDARYFRVGVNVPAGSQWGNATGFQMDAEPSGKT